MIILKGDEKLDSETLMSLIGKILAVIYARVSTTDQAKNGYSLESQIERCKERAESKFNIDESEIIVLVEEGGMGDDPNRPALNYALFLLEKGLGKKFLILHPDRLTRDNTLQGVVSRRIWNMGVDIEFIEFEVNPNDPESMLMYNIQGSIAQYNKAKILANSKRGRITKAKKGEIPNFRRLYGYKYDKEKDILVINQEEKEVLELMVEMLLYQERSCNQIAQELSKRGIEAPNGNVWYQTTVTRILRNENYKGIFHHGKTRVVQTEGKKKQVPRPKEEWIAIKIPQLIDDETYVKIQDKIDSFAKNKGRKSKDYLLKGIAKCGRCGGAAGSGITSKVKDGIYKYYACRKKASKGYEVGSGENVNECKGRNWRVDIVDDFVWLQVQKILQNPTQLAEKFANQNNDKEKIEAFKAKQVKLNKKLEELSKEESNYILLFGKGKISEEQFDTLVKPINIGKNEIKSDIDKNIKKINAISKNIDQSKLIVEYIKRLNKTLDINLMSSEDKKKIIKILIDEVILYDDDTVEIIWSFNGDGNDPHKKLNHRQAYGRQAA